MLGDELPLADTHGTVAFVLPEYGLLACPLARLCIMGRKLSPSIGCNLPAVEL